MYTESVIPAVLGMHNTGGGENVESISEIVNMGPSSPAGEVDKSTTSNVMEIMSQAVMGTVNSDLYITFP